MCILFGCSPLDYFLIFFAGIILYFLYICTYNFLLLIFFAEDIASLDLRVAIGEFGEVSIVKPLGKLNLFADSLAKLVLTNMCSSLLGGKLFWMLDLRLLLLLFELFSYSSYTIRKMFF